MLWLRPSGGGFHCRSPECGSIGRRSFLVNHVLRGVINMGSCVGRRPPAPSLGSDLSNVVFVEDQMIHDVMKGVSGYVDEFEVLFHLS